MAVSVIVVEDDQDLCEGICTFLAGSGVDVRGARNGAELDRAWSGRQADILVLDVNLPGESGFSIASRMRAAFPVGIIVLTARGLSDDRVTGAELGVDNYLVKPVAMRELLAVVRQLASRMAASPPVAGEAGVGGPEAWSINSLNWDLITPGGAAVRLTAGEFKLLSQLMAKPGALVAREEILAGLGKSALVETDRSLDSMLARLRRKVEAETGASLSVRSVRAVGYVFQAGVR